MERESLRLIVLLQAMLVENRQSDRRLLGRRRAAICRMSRAHRRQLMGVLHDAVKLLRASAEIGVAIARINERLRPPHRPASRQNPDFPGRHSPLPPGVFASKMRFNSPGPSGAARPSATPTA